jgi:histone H3/H4
MARTKATAKKSVNDAPRTTIAAEKMAKKYDPKVVGTVSVRLGQSSKTVDDEKPNKPKKRRISPGTKALREIEKYQRSTELLIPKAAMVRLFREEINKQCRNNDGGLRVMPGALAALHEASEAFMVQFLEMCNLNAIHAKRVTVMRPDLDHAKKIHSRYTDIKFEEKYDGSTTTMVQYRAERREANKDVNEKRKARALAKAAGEAAAAAVAEQVAAAHPDEPAQVAPAEAEPDAAVVAAEPKKKPAGKRGRKAAEAAAPADEGAEDENADAPADAAVEQKKKPTGKRAKKQPPVEAAPENQPEAAVVDDEQLQI